MMLHLFVLFCFVQTVCMLVAWSASVLASLMAYPRPRRAHLIVLFDACRAMCVVERLC